MLLKEIEFPKDILATITRVQTSPDLREAVIFVSVMPEEERDRILNFLAKRASFLQQKINKRLKMKFIPRIIFREETKTAEAGRIEEILEELKKGKE